MFGLAPKPQRLHCHRGAVELHPTRERHQEPDTWAKHLTEVWAWKRRRKRHAGGMVRLGEVLPKWALAAAGLGGQAAGEPASGPCKGDLQKGGLHGVAVSVQGGATVNDRGQR